ncbi:hypothetical protein LEP1GSC070_0602 [Leptospira santarosai str. AIM]|nr:hypothetical protein LEP1GSC070_0602 [Leptospira santarosai str. AIM]
MWEFLHSEQASAFLHRTQISLSPKDRIITKQRKPLGNFKFVSNRQFVRRFDLKTVYRILFSISRNRYKHRKSKTQSPPRAFLVLKKWEARITVFESHADFLFAGIPTQSVRTSCSNRRVFYLAFYDEDGKRIEPKKSLTVEVAQ